MLTAEQLQQLLTELGDLINMAVEPFDDSAGWTLAVDEQTEVTVDYEPGGARLMLSAELGIPGHRDLAKLYQMLLVYNGQWQRTGGLFMSLDTPDGPIRMALAVGTAGLSTQRLAEILTAFLDIHRGWQEILASDPDPDGETSTEDGIPSHAIRA